MVQYGFGEILICVLLVIVGVVGYLDEDLIVIILSLFPSLFPSKGLCDGDPDGKDPRFGGEEVFEARKIMDISMVGQSDFPLFFVKNNKVQLYTKGKSVKIFKTKK